MLIASSGVGKTTTCLRAVELAQVRGLRVAGVLSLRIKIIMLDIKILGYRTDQTFVLRRVVAVALDELRKEQPDIESIITNVRDCRDILQYTDVLMAPGLVVNGKLEYLCLGRIPKKEQVIGWLRDALNS